MLKIENGPDSPELPEEFTADPEPGYDGPSLDPLFSAATPGSKTKTKTTATGKTATLAIRKDIRGKVAMMLMLGGTTLSSRDAHCGQALLDAIPDSDDQTGIATALTDLICDSPDVVKWFTSSGKYMKWLTLAMAVQPVLSMLVAHHITHTVTEDEDQAPADWSGYAAS